MGRALAHRDHLILLGYRLNLHLFISTLGQEMARKIVHMTALGYYEKTALLIVKSASDRGVKNIVDLVSVVLGLDQCHVIGIIENNPVGSLAGE
jgi:hypothetical protein